MMPSMYAHGMECFGIPGAGFFIIAVDLDAVSHLMMVSKATFLDMEGPHAVRLPMGLYVPARGQARLA